MKRNHATLAVLLAALSFFAAPSASAISQSQVQAIKSAVATVPAAEIAAKSALIVRQASDLDRKDVAVTTVREVVSKRPATVLAVVSAIARTAPAVSADVAAEAAKICADQASEIARVAASSAPEHADQIAAAVAQAAPKSATTVARSVAATVPEQVSKISDAVVKVVPAAAQEIKSDATLVEITRLSRNSALQTAGTGIITTRPGTIRGTTPLVPPSAVGEPVLYGAPH